MSKNRIGVLSVLLVYCIVTSIEAGDKDIILWKPQEIPKTLVRLLDAASIKLVHDYLGKDPSKVIYCFSRLKHILKGGKNTGAPTLKSSDNGANIIAEFSENNRSSNLIYLRNGMPYHKTTTSAIESTKFYHIPLSDLTSQDLRWDIPSRRFKEYLPGGIYNSGNELAEARDAERISAAAEAIRVMRNRFGSKFVPATLDETNGHVMFLETPTGDLLFTCQKQEREYQLTVFLVHEDTVPAKKIHKRVEEALSGRPRIFEEPQFFTKKGLPNRLLKYLKTQQKRNNQSVQIRVSLKINVTC